MECSTSNKLHHQVFNISVVQERRWTPPPQDAIWVDVDRSVKQQNSAACGGLVRNSEGDWLMGFKKCLGCSLIIEAELVAIRTGLEVGKQLGCTKIMVYSDSLEACNLFMHTCAADNPLKLVINDIRDLVVGDREVTLHHTTRTIMGCADFLAKTGHSDYTDTILIPEAPTECLAILLEDKEATIAGRSTAATTRVF
ncbi:uncharacterized protein LOC114749985 [Neltuma alba]|uniref:uncharacterized protein LOC114749985 n=1 Tax=Neltuma alba TaxID=207710 RepID=UPI0010A372FE|nr:uncharacterized protein LOC114749985 [Prosopis alba]